MTHDRHLVLVVGDVSGGDETNLTGTLLDAGFDAIAVETGQATLKLLDTGVAPCAVVIDADLPDMDGWDLWRRVHACGLPMEPSGVLVTVGVGVIPAGVIPIRAVLKKPAATDRVIAIVEEHCPRPT
jgi:CheY-like chemotaxis protein